MDAQMDYRDGEVKNNSFDLMRDLQLIHDECLQTVAMGGQELRQGLPPAGTPVPLIGRTTVMSQAAIPTVAMDHGEDRGVKRKYCSSNSESLTPSAERQILADFNMYNQAVSFPDFGALTDGDFNDQIESPTVETVFSPQGPCSVSSMSSQSTMQHSPMTPNVCSPAMENHRPASVDVFVDSATRTEQITIPDTERTGSNSGMPPDCKLELTVGFTNRNHQKTLSIERPDGFILFHEKTPDPTNHLPKDCTFIRFPDPDEDDSGDSDGGSDIAPPPLDEKQKKYIKKILENMWGGLQVRCHDGCVYATRWSKAKIYYKSYETRDSGNMELPRGEEQLVFNLKTFETRIAEEYRHLIRSQSQMIDPSSQAKKDENHEMNPTIYFSVAQKWAPDCHPLKTCLVWAQLKPCRALFEYEGLFHTKHRSLDSFHSNLLQVSLDLETMNLEAQGNQTNRGS